MTETPQQLLAKFYERTPSHAYYLHWAENGALVVLLHYCSTVLLYGYTCPRFHSLVAKRSTFPMLRFMDDLASLQWVTIKVHL